jgi:hypothetical protein
LALWRISDAFDEGDADCVEHLIDIYLAKFPEQSGFIPLYLLLDFVMEMEILHAFGASAETHLATRLQVIRNHCAAAVDENWLKQTRAVTTHSRDKIDLLVAFEKSLQAAIQKNYLHEDQLTVSARESVSELRARRDSLPEG